MKSALLPASTHVVPTDTVIQSILPFLFMLKISYSVFQSTKNHLNLLTSY
jgi:hypothetical protein